LAAARSQGSFDVEADLRRVSTKGERKPAMNIKTTSVPGITIADQPTEDELRALKAEGYSGVVNLRHDGEPEQPLSTSEEGKQVQAMGLDYVHYGVGGGPLTTEGVASVCAFLDKHAAGKVLVHCRKGARAAALVLIHEARAQNWAAEEAVAKGRALGLEIDGGLRLLVEHYLQTHP
jgi:uncharacterized protein (TIGR01244 family)